MSAPPCLCIIGWSGAGKTTLLTQLLPVLRERGLRVLALKHSGHSHPLHKRGSDSERLERAGATAVGLLTPEGLQLTFPEGESAWTALLPLLAGQVDLVLIEGWKDGPYPKLEVWREGLGSPLCTDRPVVALVTDAEPAPAAPHRFRTSEVPGLALFIARWAQPGDG